MIIAKKLGDGKTDSRYVSLGAVYLNLGKCHRAKEDFDKALDVSKKAGNRVVEANGLAGLAAIFASVNETQKAKECCEKALAIIRERGNRASEAEIYRSLGNTFYSLENCEDRGLDDTATTSVHEERRANLRGEQTEDTARILHLCYKLVIALVECPVHYHSRTGALVLGDPKVGKVYYKGRLQNTTPLLHANKEAEMVGQVMGVQPLLGKIATNQAALQAIPSVSLTYIAAHGHAERGEIALSPNCSNDSIPQEEDYLLTATDILRVQLRAKLVVLNSCHSGRGLVKREGILGKKYQEKALDIAREVGEREGEEASYWNLGLVFQSLGDYWKAEKCFQESNDDRKRTWRRKIRFKELGRARVLAESMADKFSAKSHISADPQSWFGIEDIVRKETNCDILYISYYERRVFLCVLKGNGDIFFRATDEVSINTLDAEHVCDVEGIFKKSAAGYSVGQIKDTVLHLCYKWIIAPVEDLLTEPEIVIVPDRFSYRVPFAALRDEPNGKKEAETVGRLLGVQPLLRECATKQAALQEIPSVRMIHIIAQGNVEGREIALALNFTTNSNPQKEDYLLTVTDILGVRVRAKLVVLSCPHVGRGMIKKEGVLNIARAFLASGARSVLAASWALRDKATAKLMKNFYQHLVHGESVSESLHQAVKWLRSNGFPDLEQWAPFVLMGDNVTFDFTDIENQELKKDNYEGGQKQTNNYTNGIFPRHRL
ncbi:Tetratricopeptide repeat protein 28 [Stylophora pistillata]|uniref:Tetratricopeptide repeat protein 28 n=1 Tax=Stylophora pistillata TaxID=50429 RepID=A0A2B4RFP4_STYPI|nr:Tetratricopeptide repeat protein 28 [Stylophora pistillata]